VEVTRGGVWVYGDKALAYPFNSCSLVLNSGKIVKGRKPRGVRRGHLVTFPDTERARTR